MHLTTFSILNVKFTVHIKAKEKVAVASSLIFLSLQLLTYHPVQNQVVVICLLNQQHAKNFSTKKSFRPLLYASYSCIKLLCWIKFTLSFTTGRIVSFILPSHWFAIKVCEYLNSFTSFLGFNREQNEIPSLNLHVFEKDFKCFQFNKFVTERPLMHRSANALWQNLVFL